jgi:hypothetical protein
MYEQAMGDSFSRLDPAVQRFHKLAGLHELHGWVQTDAPSTMAARLLARCLGTPLQATSGAISFELRAAPKEETWTRYFPGQTMSSTMRLVAQQVVEQLGLARLTFELREAEGRLEMHLMKLHFLGVPCPRWLLPSIVAEETGEESKLHFRIEASLPVIGRVAGYRGYLALTQGEPM